MSQTEEYKWINYYRNSLADGEMLDIRTKDCDEGKFYDSFDDLNSSSLVDLYNEYNKSRISKKRKSKQSNEEEENNFPFEVFISPFHIKAATLHGKKPDNFKTVFPYWIPAKLSPTGELSVASEENRLPWFMRSVLEPIGTDTSYFPILSSVNHVDSVLDSFRYNTDSWAEYWKSAEDFFEKATGSKYKTFSIEGYNTINQICIIKAKNVVAAQNILRVYDDLKIAPSIPSLLSNLLNFSKSNRKNIPNSKDLFLSKGHYGQYNNQFPLSSSQRESLLIFEQESNGDILAVNGPPGTGKTTLLQSIVANEMVKAALKGDTPPKMVASSTNNQAITNILESFDSGKDSIERWIPKIKSLGSYLISSDSAKQEEASLKGYQILTRSDNLLEGYYFSDINTLDPKEVEQYYIECYKRVHGNAINASLNGIIEFLKSKIESEAKEIDSILQKIYDYNQAEKEHFTLSELPDFKNGIDQQSNALELLEEEKANFLTFRDSYNKFTEKNRLLIFFSFIGSFQKTFQRKLSLFLVDSPSPLLKNQTKNHGVETILLTSLKSLDQQIPSLKDEINSKNKTYNNLLQIQADYELVKSELLKTWQEYLETKNPNDRAGIENEFNQLEFFEQANRIIDISLRYKAFINAIHYWEGLWIVQHQKEELSQNKGSASRKKTFSRISYLTPLFISTFHSLPGFCSFFDKKIDSWIQLPIYELFDLLIVDEAGQVSPEIGVASFGLAQKALVVGDIHQIEPVWNIAFEKIDKGNLKENNLFNDDQFDDLKGRGLLCSSGSLMHLAQNASSYEVNSTIGGGTLLTEHRRCVDELVAFSNELVYENLLKPMVGSLKNNLINYNGTDIIIPPLSYINVRGISDKRSGSSYNPVEAKAIAKWIVTYGVAIVSHYNKGKSEDKRKELKDIIAVITPFAEQKREIYRQFEEFNIDTEITVGTVHALQGAERPIIIFSPTYGTNQLGSQLFFDSGYNMLNVALTRAKERFIVIGNISLFNSQNKHKPSGGLAKYLFADELNELSSSFLYNDISIDIKSRVDSLDKHQKCISRALEIAKERVIIVSPFISILAISNDKLVEKIRDIIKKNIKVFVYTDKCLDMPNGKLKKNSQEGREALIEAGAELILLNGIHNKALIKDDDLLIEGSFNWLSAIRDTSHPHYRFDVSHIIKDDEAKKQIEQLLKEMEKFAEQ